MYGRLRREGLLNYLRVEVIPWKIAGTETDSWKQAANS